jgi:hypothetical protein
VAQLGEMLLAAGAVTREAIAEAVEAQVIYGGRLGTNLVERGHLSEERLAQVLAEQYGIPAAFGELQVDAGLVAGMPGAVADAHEMVPWRVQGETVLVLCVEPRDKDGLAAVGQALGRPAAPVICPEFRIWQLLRQHFGANREVRAVDFMLLHKGGPRGLAAGDAARVAQTEEEFGRLYDQLRQGERPAGSAGTRMHLFADGLPTATPVPGRGEPPLSVPVPVVRTVDTVPGMQRTVEYVPSTPPVPGGEAGAGPRAAVAVPGPPVPPRATPTADDESLPRWVPSMPPVPAIEPRSEPLPPHPGPTDAPPAPSSNAPAASAPPAGPAASTGVAAELAGLEVALAARPGRDDITRALVAHAAQWFSRVIVFAVQGQALIGWDARGERLDRDLARRLALPLDRNSIFRAVREEKRHYVGPLRGNPVTLYLLRNLGSAIPNAVLVAPVLAGGKVVNVLYCDNGHGGDVAGFVPAVLAGCERVGRAYEAIIAERKQRLNV